MPFGFLRGTPRAVLLRAVILTAAIAVADWKIEGNIPLGFLYLFPMLLVGSVLGRWQIAAYATVCTALSEAFDSYEWNASTGIPRTILMFSAFFGMGLFVYETIRSRKEAAARSDAEQQLKILVESSPAAVFTADERGMVLLANEAAHRLFAVPEGALEGVCIYSYLPSLSNVHSPGGQTGFRTVMQCRGRRHNGEAFLADAWFSTYPSAAGPRLAAMVVDASEELRSREENSLHQLLAGSRLLVGAVSHEIRNVCGAIAMAHANLARAGGLAENRDFAALGDLIGSLERIAAMDLRQVTDQAGPTDLIAVLDEFAIVTGPALREDEVAFNVVTPPTVPRVWADRQSLLQVLLNLTSNSQRAMRSSDHRAITIEVSGDTGKVMVRFRDSGPGVSHPERLFHPFQHQAQATGLGLYLSRAFMRSFRGDLRFEPTARGACFILELTTATALSNTTAFHVQSDTNSAGGRSQSVSREPEPAARS